MAASPAATFHQVDCGTLEVTASDGENGGRSRIALALGAAGLIALVVLGGGV